VLRLTPPRLQFLAQRRGQVDDSNAGCGLGGDDREGPGAEKVDVAPAEFECLVYPNAAVVVLALAAFSLPFDAFGLVTVAAVLLFIALLTALVLLVAIRRMPA